MNRAGSFRTFMATMADPATARTNELMRAVMHDELAKVCKLIDDGGVDVNSKDFMLGNTALHHSARAGHHEITKALLKRKADVNAGTTKSLQTPLHVCALMPDSKTLESVKILLEAGADVMAQDASGKTPLHMAVATGQIESAKLLISKGANVTLKDNEGHSPLWLAAHNGAPTVKTLFEETKELRPYEQPTNDSDKEGVTCTMIAVIKDKTETAKYLLEQFGSRCVDADLENLEAQCKSRKDENARKKREAEKEMKKAMKELKGLAKELQKWDPSAKKQCCACTIM